MMNQKNLPPPFGSRNKIVLLLIRKEVLIYASQQQQSNVSSPFWPLRGRVTLAKRKKILPH